MKRLVGCFLVLVMIAFIAIFPDVEGPGVSYDTDLHIGEDGLAYKNGEDQPFTGRFHMAVCEECSMPLLRQWSVHYVGHYQDGLKHGVFWFPHSTHQDSFFEFSDLADQRIVNYMNGQVDESAQ